MQQIKTRFKTTTLKYAIFDNTRYSEHKQFSIEGNLSIRPKISRLNVCMQYQTNITNARCLSSQWLNREISCDF